MPAPRSYAIPVSTKALNPKWQMRRMRSQRAAKQRISARVSRRSYRNVRRHFRVGDSRFFSSFNPLFSLPLDGYKRQNMPHTARGKGLLSCPPGGGRLGWGDGRSSGVLLIQPLTGLEATDDLILIGVDVFANKDRLGGELTCECRG